ncbi:MAG TPA: hypothetical protein VF838_04285 [Trebonia sp.]
MILRCTKKLLDVIKPRSLAGNVPDDHDWYATLLWPDGRADLSQQLRRHICSARGYAYPIELVQEYLRATTDSDGPASG